MINLATPTLLFVPADRPERFDKALASGAGQVIVDLEDAVASADKNKARTNVLDWCKRAGESRILLRINDDSTKWHADDLVLAARPEISGVVLPKTTRNSVTRLAEKLDKPILPLIETATGLMDLASIVSAQQVDRLLLGTIDLALDLGLDADHPAGATMLGAARYQLVVASAARHLPRPIDGVFTDFENEEGLRAFAISARASGMGGMMCIHPKQLATVTAIFAPSEAAIIWAECVLREAINHPGAFAFEGKMIDAPILARAQVIVQSGRVA